MTAKQAVVNTKLSKPPPTGVKNYQYLQQIRKQQQLSSIKNFSRWSNKTDAVPTLEAIQKLIAFYHDKNISMLKLGCNLPNLANICLHKSTDTKFYTFKETHEDLLEKIGEDVLGGRSIAFIRNVSC